MKGVGSSSTERLHTGVGPNQWEMVAMDYVDLNDLVPQVLFFTAQVFFLSVKCLQVDDARLEGDHERVEVDQDYIYGYNF